MKTHKVRAFLLGLLPFLAQQAWALDPSVQLQTLLSRAQTAHSAAATHLDWHQSPFSPDHISEELQQLEGDEGFSEALCALLANTPTVELYYFYDYLETNANKVSCGDFHKARYEDYLSQSQTRLLHQQQVEGLTHQILSRQKIGPTQELKLSFAKMPVVIDGGLPDKTVVLTFDDGPHPTRTEKLLQILKKEDALSQFFLVGRNTTLYPQIVQSLAREGHEVGCHSYTHPDLRKLSLENAKKEIEDGFYAITRALGHPASFFRYPYGAKTTALQKYLLDTRTADFFWNIDSLDWKHKDPDFLLQYTLKQVRAEGRGVILFHDIQPQTIAMMPAFLTALKNEGYQLAIFRPDQTRSPQ